jgi:hypothetical protein
MRLWLDFLFALPLVFWLFAALLFVWAAGYFLFSLISAAYCVGKERAFKEIEKKYSSDWVLGDTHLSTVHEAYATGVKEDCKLIPDKKPGDKILVIALSPEAAKFLD